VISGDACEIGIETDPEHRRRELAAITAVATVEYAQSRGFQHIWWICNAHNPGSIRTAEKVGFEKQFESKGYGFIVEATEHKRQAAA
jgi:RimJ/RimL family protein N-acetyltransferase